MEVRPDWYETFFTGLAVELWRLALPPEVTNREADFLVEQLELRPGSHVLDVPCGHGRLTLELAARGFRMTGVDLSEDALAFARADAAERGPEVDWQRRDMRDLPWPESFDAAFCVGNSFGYLEDGQNEVFLAAVERTLKPGARFVLNCATVAEALLPKLGPEREMTIGDIRFGSRNRYVTRTARLETEYTFERGDVRETRWNTHRVFLARELVSMLEAAGFAEITLVGDVEGTPFALGSPWCYAVARKV